MPIKSGDKKKEEFDKSVSSLSPKAKALWDLIPEDGRSVTNQSLRYRLRPKGISYEEYYKYREELDEKDLILFGRGRGGTVRRNLGERLEEAETKQRKRHPREDDALYKEVKQWLENDENKKIDQEERKAKAFAAITARPSGYEHRSGRWSRPDVMLVEFNSYAHLPRKTDMTVKSYEIKKYDENAVTDPANVFETASHQKGAHYSYLVIALLGSSASEIQGDTEGPPEDLLPILERFGVGFAWFYKTGKGDYDMNIVLEAERQNPDPADENEMVEIFYNKLTPAERNNFEKWTQG